MTIHDRDDIADRDDGYRAGLSAVVGDATGRRFGARRSSSGHSWSADAVYNIGDSGEHHGSVGHHALSDFSGSSSEGASAGDAAGADGGGGGSSD